MHSAILVIETPPPDFQKEHDWTKFLATLPNILKKDEKTEILSKNVFLIPLQSGLSVLSLLIRECLEYNHPYKVLFVKDEPIWLT